MKEKKVFLCPYCKKDLKELGFRTEETVNKIYDWQWSKKKKYFKSDEGDENEGSVDGIYCNDCDNDISDYVRNCDLI